MKIDSMVLASLEKAYEKRERAIALVKRSRGSAESSLARRVRLKREAAEKKQEGRAA